MYLSFVGRSTCKERKCEYMLSIDSLAQVTKTDLVQHLLSFNRYDVSPDVIPDRKSTRLNSSHTVISYAVFCLKKKKKKTQTNIISPRADNS